VADASSEQEAAALVRTALGVAPDAIARQSLSKSGNAVFRAELPGGASVALRVSSRPATFAWTARNLDALRGLGLPVSACLAQGATSSGGSFVILEWLPGRDLLHELPALSRAQMTRIAEAVHGFQQRVATLPESRGFGWAPIGRDAPTAAWSDIFGAPVPEGSIQSEAPPAQRLGERLRAVRRTLEPYFERVRPICFLDDLTTKNLLVEAGAVCGIIDLDFVCYGDPLLSVGTTLAELAADHDPPARFYGEELLRCRDARDEAARAAYFYAALWALGFLNAAVAAADHARATRLVATVDALLDRAAGRVGSDLSRYGSG
jgi:aminoglycoside phosphotransferase (APT) family kinase protein